MNSKLKKYNNIMKENLFEYVLEQLKNKNVIDCYNYLNNNPNLASKLWDDTLECLYHNIKPTEINTISDLAKLLDGNEDGHELDNDLLKDVEGFCKDRNWLIVYPYSDDNVELRGVYDDELGAWDGTILRFVKAGDFYMVNDDEELYRKASENMFVAINEQEINEIKKSIGNWLDYNGLIIEALWEPKELPDYAWAYHTLGNVDYVEFDILSDGEPWARCMIIDLNNIW